MINSLKRSVKEHLNPFVFISFTATIMILAVLLWVLINVGINGTKLFIGEVPNKVDRLTFRDGVIKRLKYIPLAINADDFNSILYRLTDNDIDFIKQAYDLVDGVYILDKRFMWDEKARDNVKDVLRLAEYKKESSELKFILSLYSYDPNRERYTLKKSVTDKQKNKAKDIFHIIEFRYTNVIRFLTDAPEDGVTHGGIFPAIIGTVLLVFIMTVAVIPIGVITAIYLNEYAGNNRLTRLIRLAVNNLAGVPAIVFGLFGLGFFIQFVGKGIDNVFYGGELNFAQPAILWASLTLALLTLPVVIVSTEESIRAIPSDLREASYALGATKFQTITRVIIPNALSGILTGGILAVSRGAGEVAPILFTGAVYLLPDIPTKLTDQFMELGYHIFIMTSQSPNVEATKPILFATVLVLLVLTFLLNFLAIIVRLRLRKRFRSFSN